MSDNDTSRLSRLVAIVTQLQSKRMITSTYLAEQFNVSVRTIYRDIRTLESAGVPVVTEEGKGYTLMEGYRLPPVMFSEEEANALITAEKLVQLNKDSSLSQNYVSAVTKIKSVLRSNTKDKAALLSERVAFEETSPLSSGSNLLSSLQIALTHFDVVRLAYRSSAKDDTTLRFVEPFAVINRLGENWYLIAWCRLRQDFRLFRFDRIIEFEIINETFKPHKISLEEFLENYRRKF
ncbi:helix-turn-helix transcriptional regulator [Dyadobacter sandarakinus]|uniref:YafY family transcriptional regulator n=1 Tax=Dyadobacter sandarakinus TaxID=2747268 RepID=A0ABX7I437_9BACT|nr:YafY family protein [Dyadobacter sandarakinus]QRR00856.1 YafY family transcriptional regulator [Dyadobacter sandarakinus]